MIKPLTVVLSQYYARCLQGKDFSDTFDHSGHRPLILDNIWQETALERLLN